MQKRTYRHSSLRVMMLNSLYKKHFNGNWNAFIDAYPEVLKLEKKDRRYIMYTP